MKKKNFALRVATGLMMAVLLTTCVISGTFAKYVTENTGSASAKVAKWGVTVESTTTGETYLAESYKTGETVTVKSSASQNMLAPGTSGTIATVVVKGKPEVAANVTRTATLTLTGWEVDGSAYCPLVITVNGTEYKYTTGDFDEWVASVEAAIELDQDFAVNYDFETEKGANLTVAWSWVFEGENAKDTKLGDAGTATLSLEVETIVTQLD